MHLPFVDFAKISVRIPVSRKVFQNSWMRISLYLMCYVNVPEPNLEVDLINRDQKELSTQCLKTGQRTCPDHMGLSHNSNDTGGKSFSWKRSGIVFKSRSKSE